MSWKPTQRINLLEDGSNLLVGIQAIFEPARYKQLSCMPNPLLPLKRWGSPVYQDKWLWLPRRWSH